MTVASDHAAAFLQAIIANPADDAVRLIFADWLDDNGEPERAEFIRVQLRLAELRPLSAYFFTGEPEREEFDRLERRERELLPRQPYPSFPIRLMPTWRRGFVAEINCQLSDWIGEECPECGETGVVRPYCSECHGTGRVGGHGPAIVRQQPIERVVTERKSLGYAGGWCWFTEGDRLDTPDVLPTILIPAMNEVIRANETACTLLGGMVRFDTEAAAMQAMSQALLAWAKGTDPANSGAPT